MNQRRNFSRKKTSVDFDQNEVTFDNQSTVNK